MGEVQDDIELLYRNALKGTRLQRDAFQSEMQRKKLYYDRDQTGESGWHRSVVDTLPHEEVVRLYRLAVATDNHR